MQWKDAILAYALGHDIYNFLQEKQPEPEPTADTAIRSTYLEKYRYARTLLTSTLSKSASNIRGLKTHITVEDSTDYHDILRIRAENTEYKDGETIDEYIERDLEVLEDMEDANYADIEDKRVAVNSL